MSVCRNLTIATLISLAVLAPETRASSPEDGQCSGNLRWVAGAEEDSQGAEPGTLVVTVASSASLDGAPEPDSRRDGEGGGGEEEDEDIDEVDGEVINLQTPVVLIFEVSSIDGGASSSFRIGISSGAGRPCLPSGVEGAGETEPVAFAPLRR